VTDSSMRRTWGWRACRSSLAVTLPSVREHRIQLDAPARADLEPVGA
jgi:hypothetical protein